MNQVELEAAAKKAMQDRTKYGYAESKIWVDDKPFSFENHNYLIGLYQDMHKNIVIEKSAQMGASVYALATAFFVCDSMHKNVIYFFPTDTDVQDFSKTRANPMIDSSDHLRAITSNKDSLGLRRVNKSWLYFRGMKSSIAMKCHDDKTEVLTHDGWKLFKDATTSDLFATRTPHGKFEWQKASEVYSYEYDGPMCYFEQNGLNVCVTPKHRMLVSKPNGDETSESFVFAENVRQNKHCLPRTAIWKGDIPDFCIKTGRREDGYTYALELDGMYVDLRDFCSFLGFYLAEGCLEPNSNRVTLTQVKPDTVVLMLKMLERFGGSWKQSNHNYRYTNAELALMLRPLGDKYTKYIPTWVKNLPKRFLDELWKWAVLGDGHTQNGNSRYGTVSKKLADDYMEVLAKLGKHGSIAVQKPPIEMPKIRGRVITSRVPFYNVFERESVLTVLPDPVIRSYKGTVHCATVPNGTLLTRRNDQSLWSGNSIPADYLIMDELDEVSEASEALADQRLNHSDLKWRLKLSTPTFEGYGIDREFKESDMRYWNLVCKKCGKYTITEKTFPDCVRQDSDTEAYLVCRKCKSVLDPQYGVWIPDAPKVSRVHGYHICGLYSHFLDLSDLMAEYNGGRKRAEFFRSKLGLPYTAADQRITMGMIQQCIGDFDLHTDRHTFMGVDQKGNELHIVIRKPNKMTAKHDIVFIGRVREFGQLDQFMRQYDVDCCVIDGTPNQHSARDFAARFGGRVFLCYYQETMRGDYTWSERKAGDEGDNWEVKANRTEALDAMYEQVMRRDVALPRETPEVHEFMVQLTQLAKVYEEDDDGAILRAVWKRLGPEHYAHANSYSLIAQSRYGEVTNKSSIVVKPRSMARINYSRRYENGSRY